MLTQCPKCETIFRLAAADLGAAQGFVECGDCATQFNALDRLADEPNFSSSATIDAQHDTLPSTEPSPPLARANGPTFVLMDAESPSVDRVQTATEASVNSNDLLATKAQAVATSAQARPGTVEEFSSVGARFDDAAAVDLTRPHDVPEPLTINLDSVEGLHEQDQQSAAPEPPVEQAHTPSNSIAEPFSDFDSAPSASLPESEHAILFTAPGTDDLNSLQPGEAADKLSDVPSVLRRDVAALDRRRSPLGGMWITLALLFCTLLAMQVAWILRAEILAKFPEVDPVYKFVCTQLGCEYRPTDVTTAIELIARDVRDHPQYINTLLVNATLVCHSMTANSYPVVELSLYGQTGEAIGIRRFEPREYLDKSIDPAAGMPPSQPVYIVLEIAGVDSRAVSFEFSFL